MKKLLVSVSIAGLLAVGVSGNAGAVHPSCWGQASAVFAQMGEMGEHSSSFGGPRVGLRNLARSLYDAGIIEDDSMASLGAFVADELGLSIDACSR
jgi:hypothetical protein